MKALGIDYGRAKMGIATADYTENFAGLADPKEVVKVDSFEDAVKKVYLQIELEQPDVIVVGVSEGEMGEEQKRFALELANTVSALVFIHDETLSSFDAQELSIQAGHSAKKRHDLEDAFAAALVLQSWLDSKRQGS